MGQFWLQNIIHGWHWGDGIVWQVESILAFVGFMVKVGGSVKRKKSKPHPRKAGQIHTQEHWWHYWENLVSMTSIGIGIVFFLVIAFLVAPFEQYEEAHKEVGDKQKTLNEATTELKTAKIDLAKAQKDLTDSDRQRLKAVENSKELVTEIKSMLAASDKAWLDAIPSNHSGLASVEINRLTKIASEGVAPMIITNDGRISLASLRQEQSAIDSAKRETEKQEEIQRKAAEELSKINSEKAEEARLQRQAVGYRDFAVTADTLIKTFTNDLTALANEVGDQVLCNYDKMPPMPISLETYPGNAFTIKLATNTLWRFRVTISAQTVKGPMFDAKIVAITSTPPPLTAELAAPAYSQGNFYFNCNGTGASVRLDGRAQAIADMLRTFFRCQNNQGPLTNVVASPIAIGPTKQP